MVLGLLLIAIVFAIFPAAFFKLLRIEEKEEFYDK